MANRSELNEIRGLCVIVYSLYGAKPYSKYAIIVNVINSKFKMFLMKLYGLYSSIYIDMQKAAWYREGRKSS